MCPRTPRPIAALGILAALTACYPDHLCLWAVCPPQPAIVLTATAGEGGAELTDVVVEDAVDGGAAVESNCGQSTSCGVGTDRGAHHLVIRRDGYLPVERDVQVADRSEECCTRLETVFLTVALTPAP